MDGPTRASLSIRRGAVLVAIAVVAVAVAMLVPIGGWADRGAGTSTDAGPLPGLTTTQNAQARAVLDRDPALARIPFGFEVLETGPWTAENQLLGAAFHLRLRRPYQGETDFPSVLISGEIGSSGRGSTSTTENMAALSIAIYRDPKRRIRMKLACNPLRDVLVQVMLNENKVVQISPGPDSVTRPIAMRPEGVKVDWIPVPLPG